MISEIAILVCALILLLYWFRYNCSAILRAGAGRERARQVAAANHLSFLEIQEQLQQEVPGDQLDTFDQSLLNDYEVLKCLLRYTAAAPARTYTVEQRILMLDFRLMQIWYALTRKYILRQARRSLQERSQILTNFAIAMGERSAAIPRA